MFACWTGRQRQTTGGWKLPKLKSDNHYYSPEVISNFLNNLSLKTSGFFLFDRSQSSPMPTLLWYIVCIFVVCSCSEFKIDTKDLQIDERLIFICTCLDFDKKCSGPWALTYSWRSLTSLLRLSFPKGAHAGWPTQKAQAVGWKQQWGVPWWSHKRRRGRTGLVKFPSIGRG